MDDDDDDDVDDSILITRLKKSFFIYFSFFFSLARLDLRSSSENNLGKNYPCKYTNNKEKLLRFLFNSIFLISLQGGGGLVSHLKKSYSLSDLSGEKPTLGNNYRDEVDHQHYEG